MVVPFLLVESGMVIVRTYFFIQVLKIIFLTSASYEPISLLCKLLTIGRSVVGISVVINTSFDFTFQLLLMPQKCGCNKIFIFKIFTEIKINFK